MTDALRVVIADDHPIFRDGLSSLLAADAAFRVVGEAGDGEAALDLVRLHSPVMAVLDIGMPRRSGLGVVEAIRSEGLDAEVVMLTMYNDAGMFRRALDLGVKGYVLKDSAVNEITAALHHVSSGRAYISPALSTELLRRQATETVAELAPLAVLTLAEHRVLRCVAQGLTSHEIAEALNNSPKTIEHHRSHICRKLGLHGPQALLRFAMERRALLE
jgi:DNA-binding NarL/FixJ family response regulator